MTRTHVVTALVILVLVLLGAFVANNTYWEDQKFPMPPKGEAITNPFYVSQEFVKELGATAHRERSLLLPSPQSVVVLSVWHWDLSEQRQAAIEQWVESGGRLVVDAMLTGDLASFEKWSGVEWDYDEDAADTFYEEHEDEDVPECMPVEEVMPASGNSYQMCGVGFSFVTTTRPVQWALKDSTRHQAVRVAVGKGSVTLVNVTPFTERALFDGDHAELLVLAAQLRRGDEVVFLTEDDHPSLLALLWMYGAPAVMLSLVLVALFLWRGAARFGPTMAPPEPRRRSMAEQIRGSGYFAMKYGEGAPLHEAAVRALQEAARRRIPAYARLPRPQRITALGKATGMDGDAIVAAIDAASKRRPKELPNTLALLEMARRQLLNPGGDNRLDK